MLLLRALPLAWLLVLLLALPAAAGPLSGQILDEGLRADLEDLLQLPASHGSPPFARLNALHEAPDESGRLFVNDLRGPLHVIEGQSVALYFDLATQRPLLKTAPGLASGFVSFAFHPGFGTNGLFYTVHTENVGTTPPTHTPALGVTAVHHSVLTEWQASDPSANSFSGTSRELIRIAAPHQFHNLGEIAFDPHAQPSDSEYGLLYIGGGDFGSVELGQPAQLQRLDSVLGTLMRIDPLGGDGSPYSYGTPGNPFATDGDPETLREIYAYGFRNAHRLAWLASGVIFVSDIGQGNFEEINRLVAGQNYGWPEREGNRALDVSVDPETVFPLPPDDASLGFSYPVAQYDHEEDQAIAGGFVYLGDHRSPLYGKFVFGDIATGHILYADAADLLAADDGDPATTAQLYELSLFRDGSPISLLEIVRDEVSLPNLNRVDLRFGMDQSGGLYVTTKQDGFVRRLLPETPAPLPALGPSGRLLIAALLIATSVRLARRRRR